MCIGCNQKDSCWEHLKSGDIISLDKHFRVFGITLPFREVPVVVIHALAHSQKEGSFWVDTMDGYRGRINLIGIKFKKLSSELAEILYGKAA